MCVFVCVLANGAGVCHGADVGQPVLWGQQDQCRKSSLTQKTSAADGHQVRMFSSCSLFVAETQRLLDGLDARDV